MDTKYCDTFGYLEKCGCSQKPPGSTNFGVVVPTNQTVGKGQKVSLVGSTYENGITLSSPSIIRFFTPGMYKIDFVVSAAITQGGPLAFSFMVSPNGDDGYLQYAGGGINSTTSGLQVSGTGLVGLTKLPTTGYLQNDSGQSVDITYLRLNIIRIS